MIGVTKANNRIILLKIKGRLKLVYKDSPNIPICNVDINEDSGVIIFKLFKDTPN